MKEIDQGESKSLMDAAARADLTGMFNCQHTGCEFLATFPIEVSE